jgi:hypothetical protein
MTARAGDALSHDNSLQRSISFDDAPPRPAIRPAPPAAARSGFQPLILFRQRLHSGHERRRQERSVPFRFIQGLLAETLPSSTTTVFDSNAMYSVR